MKRLYLILFISMNLYGQSSKLESVVCSIDKYKDKRTFKLLSNEEKQNFHLKVDINYDSFHLSLCDKSDKCMELTEKTGFKGSIKDASLYWEDNSTIFKGLQNFLKKRVYDKVKRITSVIQNPNTICKKEIKLNISQTDLIEASSILDNFFEGGVINLKDINFSKINMVYGELPRHYGASLQNRHRIFGKKINQKTHSNKSHKSSQTIKQIQ